MTESDFDSISEEMERDSLQRAVSDVERTLAASPPGTRMPLANFVENAKGRIAALDKKIRDFQIERESQAQERTSMAALAQKEAALSTAEKERFSGFLGKESFTKTDFGSLEKFYTNTWDRLSESGKDAMSHRVWEGVRKGEYTFGELPETVREKETEHAYKRLKGSTIDLDSTSKIPEADRMDFIRIYENGDREGAGRILERDGFKRNMFRGHESAARLHSAVDRGNDAGRAGALAKLEAVAPERKPHQTVAENKTDLDLSGLDLNGVVLADAPSQGASADIPSGKTNSAPQRGSTRGS